jgi:Zn-dependent alcohol dehydrogenase
MPKAAVCAGIDQPLEVVEVDLESPKAGEVRVRMGASGVCHSDLSVVNGTLLSPLPSVLGHEGAGVVEEVGEGVTSVAPGDHVVLSFVPQCGECYFCTHDAAEMCETGFIAMAMGSQLDMTPRFGRSGSPLHQMSGLGTFSEELVCPEISTVKIDADVPFTRAALIGCGVLTGFGAAANTADVKPGDTVAVIGCGGVGLNNVIRKRGSRGSEDHRRRPVRLEAETRRAFGATDRERERTPTRSLRSGSSPADAASTCRSRLSA